MGMRVESLDLAGCQIGAAGSRYISEMLTHNSTIRRVDLSDNRLFTRGLQFIADSIKVNM